MSACFLFAVVILFLVIYNNKKLIVIQKILIKQKHLFNIA